LLAELPSILSIIVSECSRALESDVVTEADSATASQDATKPFPGLTAAATAALQTACRTAPAATLASDEARFIAYWVLTASTWPERVAAAHQPTAAALGYIFDHTHVQNRWATKLASRWLQWSEVSIRALGTTWQRALPAGPIQL